MAPTGLVHTYCPCVCTGDDNTGPLCMLNGIVVVLAVKFIASVTFTMDVLSPTK